MLNITHCVKALRTASIYRYRVGVGLGAAGGLSIPLNRKFPAARNQNFAADVHAETVQYPTSPQVAMKVGSMFMIEHATDTADNE